MIPVPFFIEVAVCKQADLFSAYRFPKEEAEVIAVKTVKEFTLANNEIGEVIFICFHDENYKLIAAQANLTT